MQDFMGADDLNPWFQIIAWSRRKARLCGCFPRCPKCGTLQVQLLWNVYDIFARWKCRICKHKFVYEPIFSPEAKFI